jgi:hypothetical protein
LKKPDAVAPSPEKERAHSDQPLTPQTDKNEPEIIPVENTSNILETSTHKVNEPCVDSNDKIIPESIDNDRIIPESIDKNNDKLSPDAIKTEKVKTKLKNTEIPADSIKHRLRSATLKPFKFLKR